MSLFGTGASGRPGARRAHSCALEGCEEQWARLVCSRCKRVHYCCKEHQREHWRAGHREECVLVDEDGASRVRPRARGFNAELRSMLVTSSAGRDEDAIANEKERHVVDKQGVEGKAIEAKRHIARIDLTIRKAQEKLAALSDSEGSPAPRPNPSSRSLSRNYARADVPAADARAIEESIRGAGARALADLIDESLRLRDIACRTLEDIRADHDSTSRWERFESGFETRDVLENGERRVHMEARLGRKAEQDDIQGELTLTGEERRRRMLEGMARQPLEHLPGPVKSEGLDNLLTH